MRDVLVAIPGVNSWGDVLLKVMPQIEQEIERKQKELLDLQQRAGKEAEQEAEQQEVERQKRFSPRRSKHTGHGQSGKRHQPRRPTRFRIAFNPHHPLMVLRELRNDLR